MCQCLNMNLIKPLRDRFWQTLIRLKSGFVRARGDWAFKSRIIMISNDIELLMMCLFNTTIVIIAVLFPSGVRSGTWRSCNIGILEI